MSDNGPEIGPVEDIDTGSIHTQPEESIALCLSGGGFRAALFHVGSLWRDPAFPAVAEFSFRYDLK